MIIAISGSHNSGKTTLAHRLYSQLLKLGEDVALLTEVADRSTKEDRLNLYTQYFIMNEQVRAEDKLINAYPLVISDRSVFDNLAYMTLNLQLDSNMNRLHIYQKAWELFNERKDLYDGILFVDKYFPIKAGDPKRHPDERWQKWILAQIGLYLDAYYTQPIKSLGNVDVGGKRVEEIIGWIKRLEYR